MEWAVPINPVCLSAHLQIHIKMKCTVTTLLLCHQFGQGLHAFITRILPKLISIIINELMQIPRAIEF